MDPLKQRFMNPGVPDMLTFLKDEFRTFIATHNSRLQAGNPAAKPLDPEPTLKAAEPFLKFVQKYFEENRPASTFYLDANMGIQLTNMKRFALAPLSDLSGTMVNNGGSVPVTQGQDPYGQADTGGAFGGIRVF